MALTLSPTPIRPASGEPELVAATRAGDDRAFGELYARYRERIFAFILNRVHDHGRAEDIAQDVFISALRRMRAGDQEIAFKPWIYEIAKNACIDEYRRGRRTREVPLETDTELSGDEPAPLSLLPTPPAAVESKQRMDDLRGAFGGLSETHHRLLVMREFEGLSYDEIGDRLNMTRQMVESGLFRARRKLNEEYQELASGRRCQQVQLAIEGGALASARSLGLRDRRRFARHLSHCQGCRHIALQAGVDEALVRPRSIAAKIAALFPFPLSRLRWPWGNTPAAADQAGGAATALGPAAVAAAALTIAGVGGTLVHNAVASGHADRPAAVSGSATGHRSHVSSSGSSGPPSAGVARSSARVVPFGGVGAAGLRGGSIIVPSGRPGTHGTSSTTGGGTAAGGSPSAGVASRGPSSSGSTSAVTAPVKQAVSGLSTTTHNAVSATTQSVGSATRRVVNAVGGAVGKAAGGVTSTASKTVQGVANTVQQASPSGPSSSSGQGSGTTPSVGSVVSSATQPVNQVVGQTTQAAGQVVPGLPH